jgi:very-short-patch-repair endonuclease
MGEALILEVDGSQHLDRQEYDADRTAFLMEEGYRVLRFWNSDVMKNTGQVLISIGEALEKMPCITTNHSLSSIPQG